MAGVSHGGALTIPPAWTLAAVVLATRAALAGLIAIPATAGGGRPLRG